MKKSLLILILTAFAVTPVLADEFTVKDSTNVDYLINHGHSESFVQNVQKNKAQIAGEPLSEEVEKEVYEIQPIKFFRKFWMYIDPALDDHSFENDHSIKTSPNYQDL